MDTDFSTWATAGGVLIVALAASVTAAFAFMTYRKFGWRIHSRLACDLRLKNAAERTLIFFAKNRFATLAKLDFQVLSFRISISKILFLVSGVDVLDWYLHVSERRRLKCDE